VFVEAMAGVAHGTGGRLCGCLAEDRKRSSKAESNVHLGYLKFRLSAKVSHDAAVESRKRQRTTISEASLLSFFHTRLAVQF
jgi:hypothetical protein